MDNLGDELIEVAAPGARRIDKTWMTAFWEVFADCVFEMDAQFKVTNLLRKPDSTFTMTDIVGKPFLYMSVDKDKTLVLSELEILKDARTPYRRFTFLSKLGRYYRMTLMGLHEGGVFLGLRGIAVDVTVQSLNEITLNWQSAIIEGGSDFVSISDMEGHVLYTNPGAYKMTGYSPQSGELLPERVFTPEHMETVREAGLKTALDRGYWNGRGELLCMDGTLLPIDHTLYSVRNDQDETILIASIIRDITDYLEHEKALEKARIAAEAANVAKSEFLSRMSHEIRTPMNAIIGMINIGLGSDDIEKKNYCFNKADSASKHLLSLINDILDMSKIEADKLELSPSEFNFESTLNNIANMAIIRAEEKQQNFTINLAPDVPEYLLCDELRLTQVITNLLINAIKFTPEKGAVTLFIEKVEEKNDDIVLKFEVMDTGIGISKEQQEKLFMPFSQANANIPQQFGGSGLGLAISRRIVMLMGGRIWFESELGKGAKFIFTISAKKAVRESRSAQRDTACEGTVPVHAELQEDMWRSEPKRRFDFHDSTLLIAEDVEINREIMSALLEETKVAIEYAENGELAVSMFCEAPEKYDLILMDINMPLMDGYEATRRIRALDTAAAKDVPIIAMTANVFREDIEKCLESGMNDHTGKPIDASKLLGLLDKYINDTEARC